MEKRRLGKSGFMVNPVGLGCMGFSHAYGEPTEKGAAVEMIKKAYDMGYNFFDTAECYTGINADGTTSYNEELVGEALHGVRDKVFIATKMSITFTDNGSVLDSSPDKIRQSVEGSLWWIAIPVRATHYAPSYAPGSSATTRRAPSSSSIQAWSAPGPGTSTTICFMPFSAGITKSTTSTTFGISPRS